MIASGGSYYNVANGTILPAGYQQVEYIEGTGTQWIDADITFKQNSSFDVRFYCTNFPPNVGTARSHVIGLHDGSNRYRLRIINPTVYFLYGNSSALYWNLSVNVKNKIVDFHYSIDEFICIIDGTTYTKTPESSYTFVQSNNTIKLFNEPSVNGEQIFEGRFYFFKLKEGNTLVRNMIPCYRISDNEIGMYDTVNDVFYTNQGTGTFVKGPNVYNRYKIENVESIYHIRGTATADFDFTLKYIDRNDNITTVTEHAVIDGNGKWDISYSGKYIYNLNLTFNGNTNITSIEFTESLFKLCYFNDVDYYQGTFHNCYNLSSIKFAKGTTLNSLQYAANNTFRRVKALVSLDLSDVQLLDHGFGSDCFDDCENLETLDIRSVTKWSNGLLDNDLKLTNLYVPQTANFDLDLSFSSNPLSYDSMIRVAGWLKDLTGLTAKTVTFKASTYNALTAEQKATLQNIIVTQKGWNLATA